MSQTDFFKPIEKSHHNRSPGSILRLRFKEDIGVIHSTYWNGENEETNPELSKINFGTNFKNRGDQFDENSFEECQMNSKDTVSGVDIDAMIELFNILKAASLATHNRSTSS